jgi:hypothetical protein
MLEQLKALLGNEWVVTEGEKVGGWKQFVCTHPKGTYHSAWFKELSLGNVVYVARMCNQLISEPKEVEVG